MNFTKFDMVLIFSMSLAIVIMSFTFPALGMTDESDEVNESDIPEFNISSDRWDIVGDFPDSPGTPTSGTIERDDTKTVVGQHQAWIDRPTDEGTSIEIASFNTGNHSIVYTNWTGGSAVAKDIYNITQEGQEIRHNNDSWALIFTVDSYENAGLSNASSVVDWEIISSPNNDEGGGLSNIPVIGGLFDAGEQVFLALAYLGDILVWAFGTALEVSITVASTLFEVMIFGVDILQWLTGTYSSIISAANSWAGVLLVMPAVLLFVEFAKIGMIGISLLPFT